jgi:hypothetical protein
MPVQPPGRLVSVGTHRLHIWCDGDDGPSVIFDAALGGSSLSGSEAGPLPRTAGRIADELYALLRAAAVPDPYVLVGLRRDDEGILAPVWKLPPEVRGILRHMWTRPKFFEALGSQIEMIGESAAEVMRAEPADYGDLPLVVISSAGSGEQRLRADSALARRSTRGRHILAAESGHWIPLDAPQVVTDAITATVAEIRT